MRNLNQFFDLELSLDLSGVPSIEFGAKKGIDGSTPLSSRVRNPIFTEDSQTVMVKMTWLSSGDACKIGI